MVNAIPKEDARGSFQESEVQGGQSSPPAQPLPCHYCALIV